MRIDFSINKMILSSRIILKRRPIYLNIFWAFLKTQNDVVLFRKKYNNFRVFNTLTTFPHLSSLDSSTPRKPYQLFKPFNFLPLAINQLI